MFSTCSVGTAELHVHHVERQQSHCCQDISGCDDRALQKEYLVGLAGLCPFSTYCGAHWCPLWHIVQHNAGDSDLNRFPTCAPVEL